MTTAHINRNETQWANNEQHLCSIKGLLHELRRAYCRESGSEPGMLGEDRGEGSASIQESLLREVTLAPREQGLIKQMEEAWEAGLGGWFNRNPAEGVFAESWSGPNSNASATQDCVWTTLLTTIGERTLPNPVRFPDLVVQDRVLIPLMEGPIRPYQCLIYANQGPPPDYTIEQVPLYAWRASHTLIQIGPVFNDQEIEEDCLEEREREESVEL